MDPLSQGVVGGVAAMSGAKKEDVRLAGLLGFFVALSADLDVLIRSEEDPLLFLEYHRHFTHSLAFVPIGALIGALFFYTLLRKKLSFKKTFLYSFLGYLTAAPLDACTSYGTHLFWPFLDRREAWDIISIIDPIFTATVLLLFLTALFVKKSAFAKSAVAFIAIYLSFSLLQRHRAVEVSKEIIAKREHSAQRLTVKPSIGNIFLWRLVYQTDTHYHVDAINLGFFHQPKVYTGGSTEVIDIEKDFSSLDKNSTLYKDIQRFNFFSDYSLAYFDENKNILGDQRYGVLPNSTIPLWGITVDRNKPDEHVEYKTFREVNDENLDEFKKMLLRKEL